MKSRRPSTSKPLHDEDIKIFVSPELLKGWQKYRKTRDKLNVKKVIDLYQAGDFPLVKDLNNQPDHSARLHFIIPASSYNLYELNDIIWSFLLSRGYVEDFFDVD